MKFNFENIKKEAKKIVIGTGVVASTLGNLEAQEAKPNLSEKEINKTEVVNDTLNQETREQVKQQRQLSDQQRIKEIENDLKISKESNESNDPEFYRNEYLKYMEHPSYKQRLAKEMFGDEIIDEEKQKNINKEYKLRTKEIENVNIDISSLQNPMLSYFNPKDNSIYTGQYAAFHELSHAAETKDGNNILEKGFDDLKNKVGVSDSIQNLDKKYQDFLDNLETKEYRQNCLLLNKIVRKYLIKNKNSIKNREEITLYWATPDKSKEDLYEIALEYTNDPTVNFDSYVDFLKEECIKEIYIKNKKLIDNMRKYSNKKNILFSYIPSKKYFEQNTEIKARLNHLRIKAIQDYNFDINNNFNINNFKELKKDRQYLELKGIGMTDEQINELMKYTAMNDEKGDYYNPDWNYGEEENRA